MFVVGLLLDQTELVATVLDCIDVHAKEDRRYGVKTISRCV